MDVFTKLNDDDLEELDAFLCSDAAPAECMTLNVLDGFLTSVISGPDMIMPSEWLPVVWGNKDGPQFADMEQAERVLGLVFRHMNSIIQSLMETPREFAPLFQKYPDQFGGPYAAEDWCAGYLAGMNLRIEEWEELVEGEFSEVLMPVMTFGLDDGIEHLEKSDNPEEERKQWLALLAPSIATIHAYWLAKRSPGGGPRAFTAKARKKTGKKKRK